MKVVKSNETPNRIHKTEGEKALDKELMHPCFGISAFKEALSACQSLTGINGYTVWVWISTSSVQFAGSWLRCEAIITLTTVPVCYITFPHLDSVFLSLKLAASLEQGLSLLNTQHFAQ